MAAISGIGQVIYSILPEGQSKYEVIKFIRKIRRKNKYRKTIITLDNANMHRNKEVYSFITGKKIFLHFQPTHSPFLNGVEELWRQLSRWIAHRLFKTRENLRIAIEEFFNSNPYVNINIIKYIC